MTKRILLLVFISFLFIAGCSKQQQTSYQGYIEGDFVFVSSNMSGHIQKLFADKGDSVKMGQPLFELDQEPEASQLESAIQKLDQQQKSLEDLIKGRRETIIRGIEAKRKQVSANLKLADKAVKRRQSLLKSGAIDAESVDEAVSNQLQLQERYVELTESLKEAKLGARASKIKAQEAAVASAEAAVKEAKWRLSQKTVNSPISGLVFDDFFEVGEFVPIARPVFSLLAPDQLKVVFYVPEKTFSQIHVSQNIYFSCDNCKKTYETKISFIAPEAEYTPPVIFSEESRQKLVYRVEALLTPNVAMQLNTGQPVDVFLRTED